MGHSYRGPTKSSVLRIGMRRMQMQTQFRGVARAPLRRVGSWAESAVDRDPAGLYRRGLRNRHFEHTVGLLRFDRFGVGTLGQREAAEECTRDALDALITILGLALLGAALTTDSQHAVLGGDVDVLRLNAGYIGEHNKPVFLFVNVDPRHPGNTGRAGRFRRAQCVVAEVIVEYLIQCLVQAVDYVPG